MPRPLLAVALASTLALTACASGGEAVGDSNDKVTLRITWWGNPQRAEATQKAIDLFEKQNPDIVVKASPSAFSGYYDKLTTELAAGAAPDVFQDDQVATWASKGLLLNLDDYRGILDTSHIDETFLNQGTVGGHLYEVPAGTSPMALVFRQDILDTAGIEAPSAATSWAEFAELAQELQGHLDAGQWALADSSSKNNHFQVFLRQRGRDWFSPDGKGLGFTKKDLADWWEYWDGLRKSGAVPPADVTAGGAGGSVTEDPVATDAVAMSIYGTSITLPSDHWTYGSLPNEASNPGTYLMRSSSWAVNAKTAHPEEAVRLVDFLVNDPEAGTLLGVSRGIPSNSTIAADLRSRMGAQERQVADYVQYLTEGNTRPAGPPDPAGSRDVRGEMFERHAQQVLFGKSSAAVAADAFMAEARQLLESTS